jgi:hypothetical protein
MYVPPIVKKRIDDAGIGRGELFTITKAERKNGTRRTIEWVIGTTGAVQPESAEQTKAPSAGPPQTASKEPGRMAPETNGNKQEKRSPSGDPRGFLAAAQGQFLLQAFSAAVDVAVSAERYASACGLELQFTSGDVREIGLTIYRAGK